MTYQEALEIITNAIQKPGMTAEQDRALSLAQKALTYRTAQPPKERHSKSMAIATMMESVRAVVLHTVTLFRIHPCSAPIADRLSIGGLMNETKPFI